MDGLQRLLLCDPRPTGRDAATSPPRRKSARCSGRWSALRLPIAGSARARRRTAVYVELGPGRGTLAADALRVLRGAGFAGAVHFVETSPVLRTAQAADRSWRCLARRRSIRCPSPAAAGRQRILRRASDPPACGRTERQVTGRCRRLRFRSRWRDRRGVARAQRDGKDALPSASFVMAVPRSSSITAMNGRRPATRSRPCAATASRRSLPIPGEQDLTAHVDFEALSNAAASGGRARHAASSRKANGSTASASARAQRRSPLPIRSVAESLGPRFTG